jgi:hypothetical protein
VSNVDAARATQAVSPQPIDMIVVRVSAVHLIQLLLHLRCTIQL